MSGYDASVNAVVTVRLFESLSYLISLYFFSDLLANILERVRVALGLAVVRSHFVVVLVRYRKQKGGDSYARNEGR